MYKPTNNRATDSRAHAAQFRAGNAIFTPTEPRAPIEQEAEAVPWEPARLPRLALIVSLVTRCPMAECDAFLAQHPDWEIVLYEIRDELARAGLRAPVQRTKAAA